MMMLVQACWQACRLKGQATANRVVVMERALQRCHMTDCIPGVVLTVHIVCYGRRVSGRTKLVPVNKQAPAKRPGKLENSNKSQD